MATEAKAKTPKRPAREPRSIPPVDYRTQLPTWRAGWEKMEPYQVKAAKADVQEMGAIADLLREKFAASLTAEQRATWHAINTTHYIEGDFFPEKILEGLRDGLAVAGRHHTLDYIRGELARVKTVALGFRPLTFLESQARTKADDAAMAKAADGAPTTAGADVAAPTHAAPRDLADTQLPVAFVDAMASQAWRTLNDWLIANAPAEVHSLFNDHEAMVNYVRQADGPNAPKALERYGIVEVVAGAVTSMDALGAGFYGAFGQQYGQAEAVAK